VFDFGQPVAMRASAILDIVALSVEAGTGQGMVPFVLGETVVFGKTTLVLDVYAIVRHATPHIASERPRAATNRARVLLVDDSNAMRASISGFLRSLGLEVLEVPTGYAALQHVRNAPAGTFQAVITDLEMEGFDGFELLATIHRERPDMPVIVWTYHEDPHITERVLKAGGRACINKLKREDLALTLAAVGIPVPVSELEPKAQSQSHGRAA
jgi:CheY-like chemotaxis protein